MMPMVLEGRALCVVGNHELNLMTGKRREGNKWFYGEKETTAKGIKLKSVLADKTFRERYLAFLVEMPLVLERRDLRVAHACYDDESLSKLIGSVKEAYDKSERDIEERLRETRELAKGEKKGFNLHDPDHRPPLLKNVQLLSRDEQLGNPAKVITSGPERFVADGEMFFAGGRWRFVERHRWWEGYTDEQAVVTGHYWRRRDRDITGQTGHPLSPYGWRDWYGAAGNVFCVDYSAGRRYEQRDEGETQFWGGLSALRWPERTLVFDDREETFLTQRYRQAP